MIEFLSNFGAWLAVGILIAVAGYHHSLKETNRKVCRERGHLWDKAREGDDYYNVDLVCARCGQEW